MAPLVCRITNTTGTRKKLVIKTCKAMAYEQYLLVPESKLLKWSTLKPTTRYGYLVNYNIHTHYTSTFIVISVVLNFMANYCFPSYFFQISSGCFENHLRTSVKQKHRLNYIVIVKWTQNICTLSNIRTIDTWTVGVIVWRLKNVIKWDFQMIRKTPKKLLFIITIYRT